MHRPIIITIVLLSLAACQKNSGPTTTPTPRPKPDSTIVKPTPMDTAAGIIINTQDLDANLIRYSVLAMYNPDGSAKWKNTGFGGEILSSPAYNNGVFFMGASYFGWTGAVGTSPYISYGKLYAVDANSGTVLWSYLDSNMESSTPAIGNGLAFSPQNGALFGFDLTNGNLVWQMSIPNGLPFTPLISGDTLYTATASLSTAYYSIVAIKISSKTILWTTPIGYNPPNGVILSNGKLFFAIGTGPLVALDAATGAQQWEVSNQQYDGQHFATGNSLVTYNHTAPLGMYSFDVNSGAQLWQWKFVDPTVVVFNSLYQYKDTVFADGGDFTSNFVVGIDPKNGDTISLHRFNANYLYTICAGNSIYAVKIPDINPGTSQTLLMQLDPVSFTVKDSTAITGYEFHSFNILTKSGKLL